jgi:RHS repeat-associated protein
MGGKAHGGTFQLSGNAQNRPTGLAYDAAGNLMSYLSATYTYDQENRLSSTAGMSYTYDGNGKRVLKSNTTTGAAVNRYWSMGGNTLAESDSTGNLTAEYIYFGGKRIARIDLPANTVHYYVSDHLGSTSVVASAAGTIEEESDYYPFGTEVNVTGPGVNELKFTGKRRDAESQLDYFGARYYSGLFGRFINADPIIFEADRAFEPQKLNLYAYASANPLRFVDPSGNSPIDAALLARVNNLRQTANQVAVAEIAAYRSGKAGTESYSARGTYLLHEAASAQNNLEDHGDLQGLFDPQGQYDNALAGLSGYLESQVQQGLLGELSNWANDPNTSEAEIKAAMYDIARADGLEVPDPNAGNLRLKELARTVWEKLLDEATDHLAEGASVIKKVAQTAIQAGDVNHQMRQAGLAGLGGAQSNKEKAKPSDGQKCRESNDGEKSWGPCEY